MTEQYVGTTSVMPERASFRIAAARQVTSSLACGEISRETTRLTALSPAISSSNCILFNIPLASCSAAASVAPQFRSVFLICLPTRFDETCHSYLSSKLYLQGVSCGFQFENRFRCAESSICTESSIRFACAKLSIKAHFAHPSFLPVRIEPANRRETQAASLLPQGDRPSAYMASPYSKHFSCQWVQNRRTIT